MRHRWWAIAIVGSGMLWSAGERGRAGAQLAVDEGLVTERSPQAEDQSDAPKSPQPVAAPSSSAKLVADPVTPPAGDVTESPRPSVFALPGLLRKQAAYHRQVAELIQSGQFADAEAKSKLLLSLVPQDAIGYYNLACIQSRTGRSEAAIDSLSRAIENGFRGSDQVANDRDFESLRSHAKYAALLELANSPPPEQPIGWQYTVEPASPMDGVLMVDERCTTIDARTGLLHVVCRLDSAGRDQPIVKGFGEAGKLLEGWFAEGTAAGNVGDLYDNHDGDHSNLNYDEFPQLTRVEFSEAARQEQWHHGLQLGMTFGGVTIGNSSTALVGSPLWRCQGRIALVEPLCPQRMALQYFSNHLYFYPEHRDHDPGHNGQGDGYGDLFPANSPYLILSQGSSGSDRPFLSAVCATLAAFRPEVKAELVQRGLLMPTVQMVFRRSNRGIDTDADYLSGKAHPTVFNGELLDPVRMVTLAHGITLDTLPPIARIEVLEENLGVPGRDYFDVAARERLFDTPCAVARLIKSSELNRRFVISAESSVDPTGKTLTYHTVVLRGETDRISIKSLNDSGSRVEIVVPYHRRRPISPGNSIESNRVDIGIFVHNGAHYSPPAFLSLSSFDNEERVYDAQGRILSIDYNAESSRGNYADPLLDFRKDWKDEFHYAADGQPAGWTRIRGDQREEFLNDGKLVLSRDAEGRPLVTHEVRYVAVPVDDGTFRLAQQTLMPPVPQAAPAPMIETNSTEETGSAPWVSST